MFALAYRITGNRADAEEIVQDAFVRLQKSTPKDAVRSHKAYLATITARLSFNRLRDQRARRETYVGEWLPEPLLTADEPGIGTEDVSFALMAVLERLSPLERVVFVLRNAFDFSFEEIMPVARRDAVTCRKIFSRARARVLEERPRFTIDRDRHHALLKSFTEAALDGNTAKLVSLLDESVVLHGDGGGKALALKRPVVGAEAVAQFIFAVTRTLPTGVSVDEIDLNRAPALVISSSGHPVVAILIDTDGERIRSVFAVANPDKLDALALAKS
ncbi:RNA polymerase sigma-70 factor, ECF subfamily [Mesorhizobium qingshengii]|uniref:RNA polymerase sigma-70 factor, ECF subfamily n=2 Tax=Mesorhizobium qingshengii TaxID=1165689 RepID=A0A1G5WJN7_9HYPH|nr:RNA polymerase sigma-70 factor, ECF subfamily [Mesorhizobium qingshengii]